MLESSGRKELVGVLERAEWKLESSSFHSFQTPADESLRGQLLTRFFQNLLMEGWYRGVEREFSCELERQVFLEVHRYVYGSTIGPHTDCLEPGVRCVLALNEGWDVRQGGVWVLATDSTMREQVTFLPSLDNSGFMFVTSPSSFHALSQYTGPAMYALTLRMPRRDRALSHA